MPIPNVSSPCQSSFTLYEGNAVRLELDWFPANIKQECDIVVVAQDGELLIFVDGVQLASIPHTRPDSQLLRYGRLSQWP